MVGAAGPTAPDDHGVRGDKTGPDDPEGLAIGIDQGVQQPTLMALP